MNCKNCEEFGKWWHLDEWGNHVYENWERNWLGCRLGDDFTVHPEKCSKNVKVEVEA